MDFVRRFKVLLSGPGDVNEELQQIRDGIEAFNRTTGEIQGMLLDIKHWSKDSHPQTGDRPQALLNNQFIKECDLIIAVFGTRFGTPTGEYMSGTEEEIEEMIKANKPVFLYFSDLAKDPSSIDVTQFNRVKAFKEKYQAHTLYGVFKRAEDIAKKIHADLSLHFIRLEEPSKGILVSSETENQSSLQVCSYFADDDAQAELSMKSFGVEIYQSVFQSLLEEIKRKISAVVDIGSVVVPEEKEEVTATNQDELGRSAALDLIRKFNQVNSMNQGKLVSMENDEIVRITTFVKARLDMDLSEDFFALGDLRKMKSLGRDIFHNEITLDGNEGSKKKFSLLNRIQRDINFYLGFENWLKQFEKHQLLSLVLKNTGSRFDEDITVDLFFPKGGVRYPEDIEIPEYGCLDFVTEKVLPYLFRAKKTFDCDEYEDYPRHVSSSTFRSPFPLPKTSDEVEREKRQAYQEWFDENVLYETDVDGDKQVITCSFSYLRQHTSMFFPAVLVVKSDIVEVTYRIRSKHSAKIFTGTLKKSSLVCPS